MNTRSSRTSGRLPSSPTGREIAAWPPSTSATAATTGSLPAGALSAVPLAAVGSGAAASVPAVDVDEPCSSSSGTPPSDAAELEQPATSTAAPSARRVRDTADIPSVHPGPLRRASRATLLTTDRAAHRPRGVVRSARICSQRQSRFAASPKCEP